MIEFFKKLWRWVRTDGLLHILACAVIVFTAGVFIKPWWALLVAVVAGLVKELVDIITKKGTAEWHDVICDLIGSVFAFAMLCIGLLF